MTKQGMTKKLIDVMRKFNRPEDEIRFERKNLCAWWDACKESTQEHLVVLRKGVASRVESAQRGGDDSGYVECRSLMVEIADHFKAEVV